MATVTAPAKIARQVVRNLFELEPPPTPEQLQSSHRLLLNEGLWGLALQRCSEYHGGLPENLKSDYMACVLWEMRCLSILKEISLKTEVQGIPVVTFKGCSLAFSGSYQPGQRVFGDIDLAIPREFGQGFLSTLKELGYCITERQGEALREGIFLDLHHHPLHQLTGAIESDPDSWFRESVPLDPRSGQILRLHPKHEFILSLFHGAKHAYSRINWIVDLAVLIRDQDPAMLAQTVRHYRAERHLWLAGQCLKHWFDLDLPPELQQVCRPPSPWDRFSPFLLRRILQRTAPDYLGMLTPLWATRGWKRRLHYLRKSLFPSDVETLTRLRQLLKMALDLRSGQPSSD